MTDPPTWNASIDGDLFRVHLTGMFTLDAWRRVIEGVGSVPGHGQTRRAIYDARAASFDFSGDDVRRLIADIRRVVQRRPPGFRVAYVVGQDADFGISRMIQMMCEGMPFDAATFRTMEDAERWVAEATP